MSNKSNGIRIIIESIDDIFATLKNTAPEIGRAGFSLDLGRGELTAPLAYLATEIHAPQYQEHRFRTQIGGIKRTLKMTLESFQRLQERDGTAINFMYVPIVVPNQFSEEYSLISESFGQRSYGKGGIVEFSINNSGIGDLMLTSGDRFEIDPLGRVEFQPFCRLCLI